MGILCPIFNPLGEILSASFSGPEGLKFGKVRPPARSSALSEILEAIARLDFVFAKTMPELPHEYTVRRRARDDADYVALYFAVMYDGRLEYWGKDGKKFYPARYLEPGDGWRYWSMSGWRSDYEGRHPLEVSRHINRGRLEESDKLRAAGLLLLEPPPTLSPRYRRPEPEDIPVQG
jgi:hypothetical protein